MGASRVIAVKGWRTERQGKTVSVSKGDLLPANSPLLRGYEDRVEDADFLDRMEEQAKPHVEPESKPDTEEKPAS